MPESKHRILLTGGTGFIGKRFARQLVDRGNAAVTVVGRHPCPVEGVENVRVAELEFSTISRALDGSRFDAVIHLAAAGVHPSDRELDRLTAINALLPAQIVQLACRHGARAVVMAGSSAEYLPPHPGAAVSEIDALEFRKLYGASKAAGGLLALATATHLGIPAANLRIFNAYGPGEAPHRLLPSLVTKLTRGERVELSAGTQVRDFIHIDDVCNGLWESAQALLDGRLATGPYNLCSGEGHSVEAFARGIAAAMQAPDRLLAFGALPLRPDDVPHLVGDPSALRAHTGWHASLSFEEGLRYAVEQSLHTTHVGRDKCPNSH